MVTTNQKSITDTHTQKDQKKHSNTALKIVIISQGREQKEK